MYASRQPGGTLRRHHLKLAEHINAKRVANKFQLTTVTRNY